ncbi:rho GTPase-activating protein 15 isoform X2 [Brachionichthys hirsutus]|uniref:rho GTPase-activating protein 15 isoform X2 n=1 Tax=Brachionichthys hirsutus TaxID=412623 RepID=UPI0036054144
MKQVQIRSKGSQSAGEPLSQSGSRSVVLPEPDPPRPISRHRRNQSQHDVFGPGGTVGHQPPLKGENLNVAKVSEGGRKQRKNWTLMWSLLTSDQLLLHKEAPQGSSQKPGGKTDVVPLCGAVLEWTTEKSKRKNVFQITTNTGSEYLLQSDSRSAAGQWHEAIGRTIESSTENGASPLRSNSSDYLPRHSSLPGYGSASPKTKQRNQVHRRSMNMFSGSRLKHGASDSLDKNGVKSRLRKFIIGRPSMKTLQEKGLIKDRVFGCRLSTLCEREGTTVPRFVHFCLDAVDKRGLEVDGIYRVSGNLATVQKLRFVIDQGGSTEPASSDTMKPGSCVQFQSRVCPVSPEEDLDLDHSQWEDIHVVTGALKLFFRELPEPLVPFAFFGPFVEAIKIKDSKHKVEAVRDLVQDLPRSNQDTMKLLFSHLLRKNQMSTQGIGIVFGPTLMWPQQDAGNMAVNLVYQNHIVEFILTESQQIFDLDKKQSLDCDGLRK